MDNNSNDPNSGNDQLAVFCTWLIAGQVAQWNLPTAALHHLPVTRVTRVDALHSFTHHLGEVAMPFDNILYPFAQSSPQVTVVIYVLKEWAFLLQNCWAKAVKSPRDCCLLEYKERHLIQIYSKLYIHLNTWLQRQFYPTQMIFYYYHCALPYLPSLGPDCSHRSPWPVSHKNKQKGFPS